MFEIRHYYHPHESDQCTACSIPIHKLSYKGRADDWTSDATRVTCAECLEDEVVQEKREEALAER